VPLIQVDLSRKLFERAHDAIGDAIHAAQIEALGIPADDRFQVFHPHDDGELKFDAKYNAVDRRDLILIRVIAVHMYPVATKRAFFEGVVARLSSVDIRREDVLIALTENAFEDWFAGR
jgi:hypothetical protein